MEEVSLANCVMQIPTVLYYDQYQKVVGWGSDVADALEPTGYPKPGIQKVGKRKSKAKASVC